MAHRRHHRKRSKSRGNRKKDKKPSKLTMGKFFFWFVTYLISISLIDYFLKSTSIYQAIVGYSILMGFLLVIISRVVYSVKNSSSFMVNGIIIWGIIYGIAYGVILQLFEALPKININPSYDPIILNILFAAVFTIVIIYLRRMKIKSGGRGKGILGKAPDQIISGIGLIVFGVLFLRFSYTVFGFSEGTLWGLLAGWGLILAGFLVLLAWWRNNVAMFNIKWWN